jgi:hypothetical protein
MNDLRAILFRRVLVVSTALAFGGMLGSLGVVGRNDHGLEFKLHWSAPLLFLGGCAAAAILWRTVFQFETGSDNRKRRRLIQVGTALGIVAFGCFLFPLRFVTPEKRFEVMAGIGLALLVLGAFGWILLQTIRWVEAASRDEEARADRDRDRP